MTTIIKVRPKQLPIIEPAARRRFTRPTIHLPSNVIEVPNG